MQLPCYLYYRYSFNAPDFVWHEWAHETVSCVDSFHNGKFHQSVKRVHFIHRFLCPPLKVSHNLERDRPFRACSIKELSPAIAVPVSLVPCETFSFSLAALKLTSRCHMMLKRVLRDFKTAKHNDLQECRLNETKLSNPKHYNCPG